MSGGTWSYDGSLDGLFLLAHRAYMEGEVPEAVANALAVEGELFALLGPSPLRGARSHGVPDEAARELRDFSCELFDTIVRIWMSEEALELPLFRICALAGLHGGEVLADHSLPDVRAVLGASRRVIAEIHRLIGLARFTEEEGLFVAPLSPDANIVPALAQHFARRFGSQDFALVDTLRSLALVSRGGRIDSLSGEAALALLPLADAAEGEVQLWKRYFKAADNPARANPELQRRLMPARYWRYLPELSP